MTLEGLHDGDNPLWVLPQFAKQKYYVLKAIENPVASVPRLANLAREHGRARLRLYHHFVNAAAMR